MDKTFTSFAADEARACALEVMELLQRAHFAARVFAEHPRCAG